MVQHSDSKNVAKRTISDNILKDRAYEIARNRNYDGYQRTLASMVSKSFDKKTRSGAIVANKAGASVNKELAEELHKSVVKKLKKRKVYARLESLSSKNKNVKYFLCFIDVFTKYAWVKLSKDKKGKTVLNAFIEIVTESNHKPNKLWLNQGR